MIAEKARGEKVRAAARMGRHGGGPLPILGRVLRDRGIITERQLEEAIQHQVLYGGRLGTSLLELGFITEERLMEALARANGVPAADLKGIQPEAVAAVPKKLATRFKVFPCRVKGKTLFLGMVDPTDHAAVAQIGFTLGYIIRPLIVPEFRMVQLLRDHYGVDDRWRFTDTRRPLTPPPAEPLDPTAAAARIDAAATRDEVVAGALHLCRCFFRRVVVFIVREPWVLGWDGAGDGVDRARIAALRIPLDVPSVFQGVTRARTVFVGRPGPEEPTRRFLEVLGRKPVGTAALFPLAVKGRVVNLIWGDGGSPPGAKRELGELMALVQKVPRAYLRIIRVRIAETRSAGRESVKAKGETKTA